MIILNLFYILIPVSIYMAFMWAPPAEVLGEAGRIMYFHVPLAWVSTLAFVMSGIYSVIHLFNTGRFSAGEKAHNSALLGMAFVVLTVITGSIWAKISWGVYWNWDPRETSIIVLLLIYIAYFSLRAALAGNPRIDKLASVYLIIAMATVPFFVFVIPRIYSSLHPDPIINPDAKINLDERMRFTLMLSMAGFTMMFFYLFSLMNRISKISIWIKKRHDEND